MAVGSSSNGWPRPLSSESPDIPRDFAALTSAMDSRLPHTIAAGKVTIPAAWLTATVASAGAAYNATSYGKTFIAAPVVLISMRTGNVRQWRAFAASVTTTSFQVSVSRIDAVAQAGTADMIIDWVAIGMTA